MACVAGEVGRFYLKHGGAPPDPLQRFIGAVCGVFAPVAGYQRVAGDVPRRAPDERVVAAWAPALRPDLLDRLPAGARHIGFWAGRLEGRVVAMAAYDTMPVVLKPVSVVPNAHGDVVVEGRFEGTATMFAGYANQGRFGVASCHVDAGVARPDFRISCPVAPGDDSAWLEIVYVPARSVLALPLVQVLARRDAQKPLIFTETPQAASQPIAAAEAFAPAVAAGLNAVRAQAGLPPVRVAEAESATAARVAGHYFAASLKQDTPNAIGDMSTIALGLMAGWQVGGTIRDGTFVSILAPHTHDAGRWLDTALMLPLGRHALLARDIEEVALGAALFTAPDGIGAVACGYRFQHGDDHAADVDGVMSRIARARQQLNLSAPVHLGSGVVPLLQRELAYVARGEQAPIDALRESLRGTARLHSGSTRGIVFEATALDALEIPQEILRKPRLYVEVGVTHYKPPGAAWSQLVIVIVYLDSVGVAI
jgi:hypothetical protein